jgi:hypothetical protein
MVVLAMALAAGRIAVVRSKTGEVPFQSANDRSRWATIAALVDYRTYRIDHFQQLRDPQTNRRVWQSIDRVRHRGRDGRIHDYSSKPPLLPTLIAPLYAGWKSLTGIGIQERPLLVGRVLLAMVNLPLLGLTLYCLVRLILRTCRGPQAALLLAAMTAWGTYLLPFAISLNNHLPAAAATALTMLLLERQARRGGRIAAMFFSGLAASFAVANELPALSLLPLAGLIALAIDWRATLAGFVPGVLLVAAGFFATNWLAHQSLRPPYAHRGLGDAIAAAPAAEDGTRGPAPGTAPETEPPAAARLGRAELALIENTLGIAAEEIRVSDSRESGRWRIDTPVATYALTRGEGEITLHHWDDWYDYPGTYWSPDKLRGVDRGEPSRVVYALQMLVGHHGIFSLTPFWLLSLWGAGHWLAGRADRDSSRSLTRRDAGADDSGVGESAGDTKLERPECPAFERFRWSLACAACLVTVVCIVFYLMRPEIDRNYGGVSVCFRWLLWQIPLWLFLAIPAVERLAAVRWGRVVCVVLICWSVFSVATALDSPWQHPWPYRLGENLGWIAER